MLAVLAGGRDHGDRREGLHAGRGTRVPGGVWREVWGWEELGPLKKMTTSFWVFRLTKTQRFPESRHLAAKRDKFLVESLVVGWFPFRQLNVAENAFGGE